MRCLFCKEASHDTKGVEHLIPESIGSKKLVLPKGLVCDKCNNYFARKVENPVLSHPSIRNLRGWYQVPNKKGTYPSVLGWIAGTDVKVNLRLGPDGTLKLNAENLSEQEVVDRHLSLMNSDPDFAPILFTIDIDPPQKEMSRFLAMMALEALALRYVQLGAIDLIIDHPAYDSIRKFARYGEGVKYWPYHRQVIFPMDAQMRHPETGKWVGAGFGHDLINTPHPETYFTFLLYGVHFTINLGGPSIRGYELWLQDHDPLERMGVKLIKKNIDGKDMYFLEGSFNSKHGAEYDRKASQMKKKPL